MKQTLLSLVALIGISATSFSQDLFFSEYVEGSGNDKAMEVYNPTSSSVNLSNYRIVRYSNGSLTGADSLTLSGTLASKDVHVVANGQTVTTTGSPACSPALQALADQLGNVYPDPLYFNGDDAIVLVKISPYTFLDIFGKIGEDPGSAWDDVFPYNTSSGNWLTANQTLVRKASVTAGVTTNPTAFNALAQWDTLPNNTWTGLGTHVSVLSIDENVKATVAAYPNPLVDNNVTIVANNEIESVTIYNALGTVVSTQINENKGKKVQAVITTSGIYFASIKFVDKSIGNKTLKITKQ